MANKHRTMLFILFVLSGFSGLIYESIWTHYLKLFLGHAAYAQTLVLAIFMGGMAIGSWLCSRYSLRWGNLLKGYAVAEGLIGLSALLFHEIFVRTIEISYTSIIPALGSPVAVNTFKWGVSALLILPQSILLGMTFPLMSSGILRLYPDRPGRSVALLYFTNSIGAVVGVLASGFFLIRLAGLPGTIRTAGIINIALSLTVWFMIRNLQAAPTGSGTEPATAAAGSGRPMVRLFLAASLVTGAASFIYEIAWIRMLCLVLGSSTHAFELMLSAFIFGLACGGLWIQRRIDRIDLPVRFLAGVQVVMGLCALSTLLLYGNTFSVMQWLVENLAKTDAGYTQFNLASSAIAIAVMLPATFCAGMTLPLITFVLLREGNGERSIGAVYAANTIGAIVGVFFAIHLGLPLLGLKGLVIVGAGLDIALGIVLYWNVAAWSRSRLVPIAMTILGIGAVAATSGFVELDLFKMGSGVYRFGILIPRLSFRHLYHLDGKTATVDVFLDGLGSMRINTNGKTDATIMTDPERFAGMDEATMTLLAAIPMALHPQATTAASIGLGSGLTTQILLSNPQIRSVDTVEIEQGIVDAAQNFRPMVDLVYTDPRSRIHVDDAKTFFSARSGKYDIIISEPSNPWVSGVSGLFSEEFYRLIRNHIADDGLFVQWVQLYEINTDLVVSVLKAVSSNFADFAVYAADDRDILIVARKNGQVPAPDAQLLQKPLIAAALKKIQVERLQDFEIRRIGTKKTLGKLLESFPIRANSDYYPVLDQNAARTRFLNASAEEFVSFAQSPLPAAKLLDRIAPKTDMTDITPSAFFPPSQAAFTAMALRDYFLSGGFPTRYGDSAEKDRHQAVQLKKMFNACSSVADERERLVSLFTTASNVLPYLTPAELSRIWQSLEAGPCANSLSALDKQCFSLFKATGKRDGAGMAAAARLLLERETGFSPEMVRYLTASGMLGYLIQGNKFEAYQLWVQYKAKKFDHREPDLLMRLLAAESRAP